MEKGIISITANDGVEPNSLERLTFMASRANLTRKGESC